LQEHLASLNEVASLSTSDLHDIPEHIGYLKSLGLDYGFGPTGMMEWILEHIHVFAGTPWWASISLMAILTRAVMFYGYIGSADNAAKMATVAPITKPIMEKMKEASASGNTMETMRLRQEIGLINKRAGIQISKSLVPMIQIPIGFGTFFLLRGMAKLPVPGLESGGILWFQNLTLPDPYFLLPVATSGILHWVLKVRFPRPSSSPQDTYPLS
jgi:YidC/Oxa1 family membrane protein insertase